MATLVNVGSGDIRENVINIGGPGLDPLRPHVAYEAMHDSGEVDAQGDCHPGTRIAIQQIIKRWAENREPDALVSLMLGAAGAGKSAIMRTVAKTLDEEGQLLGGFFCFRSSNKRNDGSLVITTLVAQILKRIPHLCPLVYQAFEDDAGLRTKTMEIQATKLLIDPLNSIDLIERPQYPYVILLDGLDEINGVPAQQEIIKVFAFINDHLIHPLHFLIASRPEPPILQAFKKSMDHRYEPLELDESLKPNDDIDVFYIDHFREIRNHYPQLNLPFDWPGVPVRRILVAKGSGQFIFASVVVAVVGNPLSALTPQERLDLVLEVTKRDDLQPLQRLDLLYVTVLCQIPEADRAQVLRILSIIVAPRKDFKGLRPTPRFLDTLFSSSSGTTRHRLCHLHSVLKIPNSNSDSIFPQHATLGDFVFDEARSKQFGFHSDMAKLMEDTVVHIAGALLSNSEKMADLLIDFHEYFAIQMKQLGPGSLMLRLAEQLQEYDKMLSSLPPLALIAYAAPFAMKSETASTFFRFRTLSRRIIAEGHRRARLYRTDHGGLDVTLLGFAAMTMRHENIRGVEMTPPPGSRKIAYDSTHFKWTWRAVSEMVTKDAKLVSMDRSSGLALTSAGNPGLSWNLIFAQNRWLSSYLPLLAQVDFVANAAKADEQGRSSYAACAWPSTLPFCWSTVSALRTCLFVMSGNDNQAVKGIIKYGVDMYIQCHWEERWRVPTLFLLRRDFKRWQGNRQ